tara:strand:+ start:502 stop:735 length:234 start_codon:yes stop_codon:yes gene_type:complete
MNNLEHIGAAIKRDLPDAQVNIEDLSGAGDHLKVSVISKCFAGLSKIQQHQLIYASLKEELNNESIHALALNTSTPN